MALHIQHLRSLSSLSLSALRVMHAKQTLEASNDENDESTTLLSEPIIRSIAEESLRIDGKECKVRRIFIKSGDSGEYKYVGWMLNEDVNNCTICRKSMGTKHHCRACGNIVCNSCSKNNALVDLLIGLGPTRVCDQCYWGQEVVYANVNFSTEMNGRMVIENLPKRVVEHGPMSRAFAVPQFVIKARRHKDNQVVFLNICRCDEIPLPPQPSPTPSRKPSPRSKPKPNPSPKLSSEVDAKNVFYLVACEQKRRKKIAAVGTALQHTRAVDIFLHTSSLGDEMIESVLEKIFYFVGASVIMSPLSSFIRDSSSPKYFNINTAHSHWDKNEESDETVHFPLPSFEAFKRTPHVLVEPEGEARERRSSESSIISDLSGGTLSVTGETLSSLEAVKINLSSDSSCFVFKSRRVSIKQDLPVGLKVFANVYTCPSSSIELAASFTKLLSITTRPHSQAGVQQSSKIYLSKNVSTISDKKGSPCLLYQVAVVSEVPDEFKNNTEMARRIIFAINNAFEDNLDSEQISFPNTQVGKSLLNSSVEMVPYNEQSIQKLQRVFVVGGGNDRVSNRRKSSSDIITIPPPPPAEPAKASRRNSTNGKIEMDSTKKDVSEQVPSQTNPAFTVKEPRKSIFNTYLGRSELRKSNELHDDDSIANSTTVGNDHYLTSNNRDNGNGNGNDSKGLRDLLTEEMFLQDSDSELLMTADAEKIHVLALSTKTPETLLGWKIFIPPKTSPYAGIYVVTNLRKNSLFRYTEFELSNLTQESIWVKLRRSREKPGTVFELVRKVIAMGVDDGIME